jgi:hypothetical protein
VPAVSVEALALAEELRALPLTWRQGDRPAPPGRHAGRRGKTSAMFTFEAQVRLAAETSMTYNQNPELPVRPVFGAVSPRAAKVVVIPRQGPAVLPPTQAELLDPGPGLPARLWIASLPAGGTPAQAVHQVRSHDANGRELFRLDPDNLTPRRTG